MLYYALVFLAVGLITGALTITGMSSLPVEIPLVLSLTGIVLVATYMPIRRTARIGDGMLSTRGTTDGVQRQPEREVGKSSPTNHTEA